MSATALTLWRILYRLALLPAYPWSRLHLSWKARREPEYTARVGERYGHPPQGLPRRGLWFHAVSAGEVIAAAPLIAELAGEFPELPFLVTTTTPTGASQVRQRLVSQCPNVSHCYAPYDFPSAVNRFLSAVQPRILILMETELWPNLIAATARRNIPALLVNARLSEKSARRYGYVRALTQQMLRGLTFIACQYPSHAERFMELGAPPENVAALGSVKFDVLLPADHESRVMRLQESWNLQSRKVWCAGSTHEGEEAVVLDAHRAVLDRFPEALLILVPRHPSRVDDVVRLLEERNFVHARQSLDDPVDAHVKVVLADTMGELLYLYGLSRVAYLGGSLVSVGGHNPIEAAVCGQPLVMGPETFNFPEVIAAFTDAGCLSLVRNDSELARVVTGYLADAELTSLHGQAARRVVLENRGAAQRLVNLLRAQILAIS